jgi:aryl carrier-like protein
VRVGFTPSYGTVEEVKVVLEKIDLLLQEIEHGHTALTLSSLGVSELNADVEDRERESYDEGSWSAAETSMREFAAEICQLPAAGIAKGATFYSLGIDSVTAIRFARGLRKMGLAVSSADVIRFPSIGALSRQLAKVAGEATPPPELPATDIAEALKRSNIEVDSESVEAVYTCTPLQSGMITQTLASDGRLYVHHHCVKLEPTVDPTRLRNSWLSVVDKTDILRSSFYHSPTAEHPWTALVRKTAPAMVIEDYVSGCFDQALAYIAKKVLFTEEQDFQKTPAQASLLRTSADTYFILSLHHSLYDGVSVPFIFHDLATAYLEGCKSTSCIIPVGKHVR